MALMEYGLRSFPCIVTIDANSDPKRIDLDCYEGSTRRSIHGIYTLEDTQLTLCLTSWKNPRPTTFATTEGEQYQVLVLSRVRD